MEEELEVEMLQIHKEYRICSKQNKNLKKHPQQNKAKKKCILMRITETIVMLIQKMLVKTKMET